LPAQAIEDRNRPHAGRLAHFLRENARTLNEPVNRVSSKSISKDVEKRWWEWNLPKDNDINSNLRNKKTKANLFSANKNDVDNENSVQTSMNEFQTTYQKDHCYLTMLSKPDLKPGALNENQGAAFRHTYNPNTSQAIGIVPVNELNNQSKEDEQKRTYLDKMSFEHIYDSRNDNNYPIRGKVRIILYFNYMCHRFLKFFL
jgi:hypothetical protein